MRPVHAFTFSLVVVIACSLSSAVMADVHQVGVGPGSGFSPSEINIQVGDTVHWVWNGGLAHNVESGVNGVHDGNFRSGDPVSSTTFTFDVVFDEAFLAAHPMANDTYPYYCVVHVFSGMIGSVIVEVPPSCTGDFNGDNTVNVLDLLQMLGAWGPNPGHPTDLNGDNTVNVIDLLQLLGAWGACGGGGGS